MWSPYRGYDAVKIGIAQNCSLHRGYCAAVDFGRVACILTCDVTDRHLEGETMWSLYCAAVKFGSQHEGYRGDWYIAQQCRLLVTCTEATLPP
jgi:hypothetical protein